MKIVSFNVNSIRARLHQLQALVDRHSPDIIALQETKVQDHEFPEQSIKDLGYHAVWSGQKTHYGVALLHKADAMRVQCGFVDDDPTAQKRLITANYRVADGRVLRLINGYFPQGESRGHPVKFPYKKQFYAQLLQQLQQTADPDELLMVVGDMNVAPTDLDIGIGEENRSRWLRTGKCSFLPEERAWLQSLLDWGLIDSCRQLNPERTDLLSWFDYRSRGFEREPRRGLRIDLILTTQPLHRMCRATGIDEQIRAMPRPSDHAPVWIEFDLENHG